MEMLIDSGMIRGKKQEEQIQQVEIEETKEQEKESIEDLQKEVEVIKEKKKKSGLILGGILVLAGVFLCGTFLGKKLEQKEQEMNISSVEYVDEYKDIL